MITDIKPWLWFNLIELIALVFINGLKCRNKCEVPSICYFCFPTGLVKMQKTKKGETGLTDLQIKRKEELVKELTANSDQTRYKSNKLKLLSMKDYIWQRIH